MAQSPADSDAAYSVYYAATMAEGIKASPHLTAAAIGCDALLGIYLKNIRLHTIRFWWLHLALPVLLALLLAFFYPSSDIDTWLIGRFYDANSLTFPLKSDWFLERILHQGFKNLMVLISLVMLALWLLGLKLCGSAAHYLRSALSLQLGAYSRPKWLLDYHRQFYGYLSPCWFQRVRFQYSSI